MLRYNSTVDRIRACWIGDAIERYVTWLAEQGYAARNVAFRVPVLMRFGEFAGTSGAINWNELPGYVEPFVEHWLKERKHGNDCESARRIAAREVRIPIQQLLHLVIPDHQNKGRSHGLVDPFIDSAPGFFESLRRDRGLREPTIVQYQHYLRRTECYFRKSGIESLADLSPAAVTALITESGKSLDKRSVQSKRRASVTLSRVAGYRRSPQGKTTTPNYSLLTGLDFSNVRSTSPLRTVPILSLSDFHEVLRAEGPKNHSLLGP